MWLLLVVFLGLIFLYRRYRYGLILENLTDKYVFITGCDTGFGNLLAKQLDKRGMKVLAACLTNHGAEELKKETSTRLQTILLDVSNSQSVSAAAAWVNNIVLDKGLWGLVNNAGIAIPVALNELLTKEDFVRVLNVNLLGLIDVTLKMLPLIRRARGRVVNLASIAGRVTLCGGGYCLSKYGVESFSDSLRTGVMWLLLIPVALALLCLFRWNQRRLILPNLLDKYVLITGCDSGFGNLAAKQLDRRGMHVLAACLTKKGAENLKKETSSRLQTVILDVTDSQSVNAAAAWAASIVGNKGLWGVVNNAGISVPTAPNEWMTKEDFSKILNVNLLGVIDVTLKMLPLIRKARGRVVNVASIAGRLTICGGGYCPSKYGVESFSDSLRREMKPFGVKICIIEPGFFATQVTDAKIIKESINKLWARAPEEIRRSYGQKYYEEYCKITDLSLSLCNTKLSLVSDAMEHALTAVHPKTRYSAGWDAKLLYLPLSYLPAVITDFIIVSLFPKLSKVT